MNATPYEIIAGVVALITAVVATRKQMKRFEAERRTLSEREREKKRIRYLDPLRVAARDLPDKITGLSKELHCKESFRKGAFREIKDKDRNNKGDFAFWRNGYGVGAVTALYVTAIYFAHARKNRSDIPFIQLGPREDQNLLKYLYKVREAFGAENDPWVEIQDSPGGYVTDPDGTIQ